MSRLVAFLELLAAHGGGEIRACTLAEALASDGADVRSALRAHGILRAEMRAQTVPCDGLGCAREVRELPGSAGEKRRFFGVCTREPAECETAEVSELDLAQEFVSREAFVAAVQCALRLVPVLGADGDASARVIGQQIDGARRRDVILAWALGALELRALAAERPEARLLTLVPPYAPDLLLTTEPLSDLLVVRDGRLAAAPRFERTRRSPSNHPLPKAVVPLEAPTPDRPPCPALAGLRAPERWGEITLFDADEDDQVGLSLEGRSRRLSCVDLGLATIRSRRPTDVFRLLKVIVEGEGFFTTRSFGTSSNGKRLMSELRTALRETFGIAGDPFEPYSRRDKGWKPKFRALSCAPNEREPLRRLGSFVPSGDEA
ncbi:MAG TPA: hypothetical protein VGI39_16810 [Polyangiaceae bacterium]|jgi:hypothetical protein